jgi:hypothetical protein
VPPTSGTIATVSYVSSGANMNETSDSVFTDGGQANPPDLGSGPYYASTALTDSTPDGLGIPGGKGSTRDITLYHQLVNGQLDLIGFQAYITNSKIRVASSSTQYSPALPYGTMNKDEPVNNRLFTLTAGQAVTQSFTATTRFVDAGFANINKSTTQRIEFIGMDSVNPGGTQAYTTCKFTNTEATAQGSQVTTLWYLQGKGILLKSITEAISTAGVVSTTNTTLLVKAEQNGSVIFPALK